MPVFKFIIPLLAVALIGCHDRSTEDNLKLIHDDAKAAKTTDGHENLDNPHDFQALLDELGTDHEPLASSIQPIITEDGKTKIDWSHIDTKTAKVDKTAFDYPFLIDSEPVVNYANAYNISAEQAQYSMLLSMASPEALGKIVDQLGNQYIAHRFRDGSDPALIIQVTPDVVNEQHSYIISDKFAEGLELPIEIVSTQNAQ